MLGCLRGGSQGCIGCCLSVSVCEGLDESGLGFGGILR